MPRVEQVKGAKRLMARSEVDSIRLIEARGAYFPPDGCIISRSKRGQQLLHVSTGHPRARGELLEGNHLKVLVKFRLEGRRGPNTDSELALRIGAAFELIYSFPGDVHPTPHEIDAFCNTNVLLNSWPYWREFVQNTVSRMNLPPLTIPLFRLTPIISKSAGRERARQAGNEREGHT